MRRRQEIQRLKRAELVWMLAGLVATQLALGIGVDDFWRSVRDPEFATMLRGLNECRTKAPGRPLVLALGSSQTMMALRPERLTSLGLTGSPLVYNFAMLGNGPMMEQLTLRRLLAAGIHPNLLVVEVLPTTLSWRCGSPIEERYISPSRYCAAELLSLRRYYCNLVPLLWRWGFARVFPCDRHGAELHQALGLDVPANPPLRNNSFGWRGRIGTASQEERDRETRENLDRYRPALVDTTLAPGPTQAYHDLLRLCRNQHIPVILLIPPESSAFRAYKPDAEACRIQYVQAMAREFSLPLVDARDWIDDLGFWDGHHMLEDGSNRYTERLGREVLEPYLERLYNSAAKGLAQCSH
jgi:hypothetical protein